MITKKFKLWNDEEKKWEKDSWAILPNGEVFNTETMELMDCDIHTLVMYSNYIDKDEEELYEGDIVMLLAFKDHKEDSEYAVVEYHYGQFKAGIYKDNDDLLYPEEDVLEYIPERIKKVGNIFENPELVMKLYWVKTEDHDEDWFIVATSVTEAARLHEDMEGYDYGMAEAMQVLKIPEGIKAERGWPTKELLIELGGEYVREEHPIIVKINGEEFTEGALEFLMQYQGKAAQEYFRLEKLKYYKAIKVKGMVPEQIFIAHISAKGSMKMLSVLKQEGIEMAEISEKEFFTLKEMLDSSDQFDHRSDIKQIK